MGKIVIATNLSLDGVVQDPDGQEGFARGGWFGRCGGADLEVWTKLYTEEAFAADALLLGRRSDEWFAPRWMPRPGAFADRLNSMPKFVVSSTADRAQWEGATVLRGDLATEVAGLKDRFDGEILVYASYELVRALLDHDLVDELRLVVFPVVLGEGARLFGATGDAKALRLTDARTLGDGLAFVTYEVVRDA